MCIIFNNLIFNKIPNKYKIYVIPCMIILIELNFYLLQNI